MIHRIGIVVKPGLAEATKEVGAVLEWLDARRIEAVLEPETAALAGQRQRAQADRDELPEQVDLLLVLGGDGTLLAMADRVAQAGRDIPILGVNFGTLGFLTEITQGELFLALAASIEERAQVDLRMMLRSTVERNGTPFFERVVLNDVVVTGGSLSRRIVEFSVSVGEELVARFLADGIIVSSPTGSTAYNLSAGGPIVHPAVEALVLNPIAPHTLTHRPVVIPSSADVRVQPLLKSPGEPAYVTFDGQTGVELQTGDLVRVRCAPRRVRLVRGSNRNYYEVLRRKLRWAER